LKFTAEDIAGLIDISAVQAEHGKEELDRLIETAKHYHFIAVHSLPSWISYLKEHTAGSGILVGGPVGFPSGGHMTEIKVREAELLVRDGVDEMDMMINVGKMKSGEYDFVAGDISAVVHAAGSVPVKVILEVHYLSDDEIKKACELCIAAGAAFVKTGTGWTAGGATVERVRLITDFVGTAIEVKASGGVRGAAMLKEMYELGVTRFGINVQSSVAILDEIRGLPGGTVEMTGRYER
jgi:deoxyribose-phosphate aldolase